MSEHAGSHQDSVITISKSSLYGGAIAVLACLLVLSVLTSGFGVVKAPAQQCPQCAQCAACPGANGTAAPGANATAPPAANTTTTPPAANATPPSPPPKSDRPKAEAFVMSFCPYGLQFLKAYTPVMELLGNKSDVEVHFVSYAMHGQKEVEGNTYLYCAQKEGRSRFPAYLRCFVEAGNYTGCVATSGLDAAKVAACVNATDTQYNITNMFNDKSTWSGGRFPVYPVDAALNTQYGVRGSPTFVLNGKVVSVSRTADSIKQAICNAFNQPPAECNTTLRTAAEAAGVGPIGAASSNGGSAGCGG